jgi:hypothetical protein
MVQRSTAVSLALIAAPNICLLAVRLAIPTFSEALSNDAVAELGLHLATLLIGVAMVYRYRFVEDHEYHRSKAIGRLSKTYRHEDKGLWEKGDAAIQRLEAKAYADFKGKKAARARERMQSNIGAFNKEAKEIETTQDGPGDYSIRIDGVEQHVEPPPEVEARRPILSRLYELIGQTVERAASRRIASSSSGESATQPVAAVQAKTAPEINSQWDVPEENREQQHSIICNNCGTFNNAGINYCTSCGSYVS